MNIVYKMLHVSTTYRYMESVWTGIERNEGWMKKQRQRAGLFFRGIAYRQKKEEKKLHREKKEFFGNYPILN